MSLSLSLEPEVTQVNSHKRARNLLTNNLRSNRTPSNAIETQHVGRVVRLGNKGPHVLRGCRRHVRRVYELKGMMGSRVGNGE
ncbi:hypothetical protein PIB30_045459 [Stylosanthes scabra]|uniref:Uncharacterized protein n=1 Tax=Stylosanthes scabra TaxID=79078 RepID=A0ABU6UJE0_9FABA|nr:hypothetical protein [Stylosanthes scabra]